MKWLITKTTSLVHCVSEQSVNDGIYLGRPNYWVSEIRVQCEHSSVLIHCSFTNQFWGGSAP